MPMCANLVRKELAGRGRGDAMRWSVSFVALVLGPFSSGAQTFVWKGIHEKVLTLVQMIDERLETVESLAAVVPETCYLGVRLGLFSSVFVVFFGGASGTG